MDYSLLGRTGVFVSNLCFGTMSFGGIADRNESAAMYKEVRDAGINFFDTANVYNKGTAEEIFGELMQHERDELIVTSKYSVRTGPDINALGSSRRHMMMELEKSLKRLKTDRIDLYFVHNFDPYTHMEEILRSLDDMVRQGKILYLGVSNWAAWQIARAQGLSFHYGWSRFECIQPMYNLVKRQAEAELLPMAVSENMAVMTYSPLAGGMLTGKYLAQHKPEKGRFLEQKMYADRYGRPEYLRATEEFVRYAEAHNVHPATLAVAWVGSRQGITSPIIGARNTEQLKLSLDAGNFTMTTEMQEEIAQIFPGPPPANDRSEERIRNSYKMRG